MCGSSALPSSVVVYLFMFGASKCTCVSVTVGVNVLHSEWCILM